MRSCRRSPSIRSPTATSSRSATCGPPSCSGPSMRSSRRSDCCRSTRAVARPARRRAGRGRHRRGPLARWGTGSCRGRARARLSSAGRGRHRGNRCPRPGRDSAATGSHRSRAAPVRGTLPGVTGPAGLRRRSYGPQRTFEAASGRLGGSVRRPPVELRLSRTGGIVRLLPRAPLTVLDGGAQGVLDLAAFGDLRPDLPLAYAPDVDREQLTGAVRDGAGFVIADGVRRRAFVSARLRGNTGPTAARRPGRQRGRDTPRSVRGHGSPGTDGRPDRRGAARTRRALRDGPVEPAGDAVPGASSYRPPSTGRSARHGWRTAPWRASATISTSSSTVPATSGRVEVYPYSDSRGEVRAVEIAGRRYPFRAGWNRLRVGLEGVSKLRIRIADVRRPRQASAGAGGIRELRIPGVSVREALRPPIVLENALRREDLSTNALTYLLQRTTADAPALRGPQTGPAQSYLLRDARDPEARLQRSIRPPAARRFQIEAWVSVDPSARDDALDRIASPAATALRARSSSRFEGTPAPPGQRRVRRWDRPGLDRPVDPRSSGLAVVEHTSAVGDPAPAPRSAVRRGSPSDAGARPVRPRAQPGRRCSSRRLRAAAPRGEGQSFPARDRRGCVPCRERPAAIRSRRAVGIGEIRGAGVAAVSIPRQGRVEAGCGAVVVAAAGRSVPLRVSSQDLRRFDAGGPLAAEGCSGLSLPATRTLVRDRGATTFVADHLRLFSAPPGGVVLPGAGGEVVDAGIRHRRPPGRRGGLREGALVARPRRVLRRGLAGLMRRP